MSTKNPAGATVARPIWTLALTSIAFFMVALDAMVVTTALPAMHQEIGGSVSTLQWVVNAYLLAFAAGIITAAGLGDRFGRRRVYIVGLVVFAAASVACAIAPNPAVLTAARAVQGIGAAIITPLSLTLLTAAFPAERRGAVIGVWGAIAGLAIAGGPLIGGAVTQGLSWHWIFWLNVPVGIVAAVLSRRWLTESRGAAEPLDLIGLGLVSGGAVALAWAIVEASSAGWGSVSTAGGLGAGTLLVIAFIYRERRAAHPMLPLRLFRSRTFTAANASGFLMTAAIFSAAFLVSQYFQFGLGYGPLETGLRFLPWTATPFLITPLAGAVSDRIGRRPLMISGLLLQAAGLSWIAVDATTSAPYLAFVIPFLVAGAGISMALPTTTTSVMNAVAPADIGRAAGVANTLQRFGGVLGVAVVAAVFSAAGGLAAPGMVVAGFRPALLVSAALSALGAATALGVRRQQAAKEAGESQLAVAAAGA
jgi:EmrB/QacA subfamily drug resistance transporter